MMGALDAVGSSAKETLDEMTTGNEPSINLDSEESSALLNKDDEIRRLREENSKLLEENRELSLRLIQHLDTKIDTLEKVNTPEEAVVEEPSVEEEVVEAEEEVVEEPSVEEEVVEAPSVQEEEEKEESISLEIPDDGEAQEEQKDEIEDTVNEEAPLTPREKALGGKRHNGTRRKRRH